MSADRRSNAANAQPAHANARPRALRRALQASRRLLGMGVLTAGLGTAALLTSGCGATSDSFVKADDFALGRVVIYRNGIAYYERRATPVDDKLTLTVPHDKVDDFLKSLVITHGRTGEPVPVSYPTQGASQGDQVDLVVSLPPGSRDELVLTYLTDAPAWKPTYRVQIDGDKVKVQGFAVVDNTSGEDWKQVQVGVGSSSALSFRYDLRSVVRVHRELLGGQQVFAQAPPTGSATYNQPATAVATVMQLDASTIEESIASADDELDVMPARAAMASVGGGASLAQAMPRPQVQKRKTAADTGIDQLAAKVAHSRDRVTIDAYAKAGEPAHKAAERAHQIRNRLVELGVAPARVAVVDKGVVAGHGGGAELKVEAPAPTEAANPTGSDQPVGESHFESHTAMTIPRNTSAMVSVLDQGTEGEVVYLYAPDGPRGDDRYAFRAMRFVNPTQSTLEAGPVTVYGTGRFIGEGLTESIPPEATALVPFAQDRQVVVERSEAPEEHITKLTRIIGGQLTAEVRHARITTLKVTHRGHEATKVFLRHRLPDGWKLGEAPKVHEVQGEARLFSIEMAPNTTREVKIEAHTPLVRTVDLRQASGVALLRNYLSSKPNQPEFEQQARAVLALHDRIAEAQARIATLEEQAETFRERSTELTEQLHVLGHTKGGATLKKHLEKKLAEMANRLQESTVALVDQQEARMLAHIQFQDAAAELTLGAIPAPVAAR